MTFSPTIGEWFISSTIFGAAARKGQVIMVKEAVLKQYGKSIAECTDREIYDALLTSVNELAAQKESNEGKRKLYYISAEFLIGKLLSNNLINLGLYDEVKAELNAAGRSLAEIEEIEPEPSLGNGGLGRLAACFLDSIASLGLNGDGVGLNYHFGLFKQEFKDNLQYETKNPWIDKKSWLNKTDVSYKVKFGGMEVTSRMYDILVTGYNNRTNKLHLFDIETIDESIVKEGIDFDKAEIKKNLTLFLYPDDSDEAGRLLRVYQQYFMVSNAAQLILKEAKERGCKLTDLHEYVAITLTKLNSTYVDGLLKLIHPDGRVHSVFKQTETRTGRISSTEPNMQNIPVRKEIGRNMRKFFVAEDGYTLLDADYSQIELRVLASVCGDKNMQEAFSEGRDIHTSTAAQVFDIPEDFVTPEMRSAAKAVNFGIIYGIGAFSLSKDIGVTVAEAKRYIKNYLDNFPKVSEFMDKTVDDGIKNGYVTTLFGRRRYIPELSASNKVLQAFGKRAAMNAPIQGAAADIIKIAMVRVYKKLREEDLDARLILQVHDELIIEAAEKDKDRAEKILKDEMENAVKLAVPMTVDVNSGRSWYEAKD